MDRNGLRPARWVITKNRHITIASEAGVWDYPPEDVVKKGKLGPGEMLALDLQTAELMDTKRVDDLLKSRHPYKAWLKKGVRYLQTDLIDPRLAAEPFDRDTLAVFQKMFNVSAEERDEIIRVLAEDESEAVGSMGDDTPDAGAVEESAVSLRLFPATVCAGHESADRQSARKHRHVAADADRPRVQHLRAGAAACRANRALTRPCCRSASCARSWRWRIPACRTSSSTCNTTSTWISRPRLSKVCDQAEAAVRNGKLVLLLSDRYPVKGKVPVHALLATGAVHHRLVKTGLRCKCNILVETGTARDAHHFACLIGYGATAVYPYLAYQTLVRSHAQGRAQNGSGHAAGTRPQLSPRHPQGIVQDHVQDGHLHHRQLPQRAAVRNRRPER